MEHQDYSSPPPAMGPEDGPSEGIAAAVVGKSPWIVALVVLILALVSTWGLLSFVKPRVDLLLEHMISDYDRSLPEITIKDGKASIREEQPYFVDLGESEKGVIVIDTRSGKSREILKLLKKAEWGVGLTEDTFVYQDGDGRVRLMPLEGAPDITINHANLMHWKEEFFPTLVYAATLLIFLYFLAVKPLQAVLFAMIPYLAAQNYGISLSFGSAVKLAVFCMIPAVLFDVVLGVTGFDLPYAFVVYVLIYGTTLIFAMKDLRQTMVTTRQNPTDRINSDYR